jgi:hypothetical protein
VPAIIPSGVAKGKSTFPADGAASLRRFLGFFHNVRLHGRLLRSAVGHASPIFEYLLGSEK